MASWKEVLGHLALDVENTFDKLKYRLHDRLGKRRPIIIVPYRGFGTPERLFLRGRVLENKGITPAAEDDSVWDNLLNMYRRFESDEVPYARVRARFGEEEVEVTANEEGFFDVWIEPSAPLPGDKLWHTIDLELLSPHSPEAEPVTAEGSVLVPPASAEFGVISDIDDTVVQTDATHLIKMARTVFLSNARTRLPFKGVAAFYRALLRGGKGQGPAQGEVNPLFYVSSSPWNIYDLLTDFFHLQDIPFGPIMFLRDWGVSEKELLPTGHRSHKLNAIQRIMDTYQDLPFILIGDSGQEDPEIYAETVKLYPDRVQAIYIRNVSRDLKRPEAVRELAKQVAEAGCTMILAEDTLPMAQHAAEMGWITPGSIPDIQVEKQADEAPPGPVERLLGEEGEPKEAPTVTVEGGKAQETKEAIDEGIIEEALDVGKEDTDAPPPVRIEGDQ